MTGGLKNSGAPVVVEADVPAAFIMTQSFKGKPPRLLQVFQRDMPPVYFVTFCTLHRCRALANEPVHRAFRVYAEAGAAKATVAVGRYVIMPDHVHLFVQGDDRFDLGLWMRGLKRFMARGVEAAVDVEPPSGVEAAVHGGNPPRVQSTANVNSRPMSPKIWQPGFFDHLLRSTESYEQKWLYVRENPVRTGLVVRAEDWPYQGEVVPIERA